MITPEQIGAVEEVFVNLLFDQWLRNKVLLRKEPTKTN